MLPGSLQRGLHVIAKRHRHSNTPMPHLWSHPIVLALREDSLQQALAITSGCLDSTHARMQTVTDATVKSSGTELNRAGVNNDCKDNSGASQACRRLGKEPSCMSHMMSHTQHPRKCSVSTHAHRSRPDSSNACTRAGGAQAVNGQISGGVQVAAAAVAGTYDSAGAKEFANNAAPAVVANTADAIKQAGIKNDCTGESAQSQVLTCAVLSCIWHAVFHTTF